MLRDYLKLLKALNFNHGDEEMQEKDILYKPEGVCSKYIKIIINEDQEDKENNIVKNVTFMGGCPGNAIGLSRAIEGRKVKEIIDLLRDVKCGAKDTSCPAQLAKALEDYTNKKG